MRTYCTVRRIARRVARHVVRLALVAGCLALPGLAPAQQPTPPTAAELPPYDEGRFTGFGVLAENDALLPADNRDRNYTGAFGFQWSGGFVERARLTVPLMLVDRLTQMTRAHARSPMHIHGLQLIGTAFTPDSLNTADVIPDDRPYGSILGLTVRRVTVRDSDMALAWSSDLTLGVLGLPLAREVQTVIHRALRGPNDSTPYDPLGWHNQISDGGEPTLLYRATVERLVYGDPPNPGARKHLQVTAGLQGSAGYYTNLAALLTARAGAFQSEFWEFGTGGSSGTASGVANQRLAPSTEHRHELYAFIGMRPRVVAYNALLQGQFRESVHTLPSRDVEHLLLELDAGIALTIPIRRHALGVVFTASGRTPEHRRALRRTHRWGSVLLTWRPPPAREAMPAMSLRESSGAGPSHVRERAP